MLAITYDDSSVLFYDPKAMAVFNGVDDANTVTSLAQAGFHYAPDTSGCYARNNRGCNMADICLTGQHISFSPNACAAVMLDSDGQTHLRVMEHSYGAENGLYDESQFPYPCEVRRMLMSPQTNFLQPLHHSRWRFVADVAAKSIQMIYY